MRYYNSNKELSLLITKKARLSMKDNYIMIEPELAATIDFSRGTGESKYPWAKLSIGQMFFVPIGALNTKDSKVSVPQKLREKGIRFTVKKWIHPKQGNGYVVKRLENKE